jgi:putative ABC transport system permease protein
MFIANLSVDYDFFKTYGMQIVAGRVFSKEHGTDRDNGFIINESAVTQFNFGTPEAALGKKMNREGKEGTVIGVIGDFNYTSLTEPVSSMVLELSPNGYNTLSIKFENANVASTLETIESEWNKMFPEKSFQYTFLDEQLDDQYRGFQNFASIIQVFTGIAILISCLGVYGLILFVVQRKVKEIGVRKVLGASVVSILQLIYKDFVWLIVAGFVIAIPVSYYFINQWLENFTYHTTIDVITYVASLLAVMIVVVITIGIQAVKASLANPVNSLRSE